MKSKLHPFTDEIMRRYQDGATAEQLAQEYGVGKSTMYYFLKVVCDMTMRPPRHGSEPRYPPEREEAIVREYQEGNSITLIASRHAIRYDTVRSILKRHNAITGRRLRSASLRVPTSEAQLGYIAALVDGEGSIRNFIHAGRRRILVRVVNTDRPLIEWLAQFGGTVHWGNHSAKPHYKAAGMWTVSQAIDVYHLLIAIEPYMIVKRSLAREAIRDLREHWHFI
jgi:transposase-like protein